MPTEGQYGVPLSSVYDPVLLFISACFMSFCLLSLFTRFAYIVINFNFPDQDHFRTPNHSLQYFNNCFLNLHGPLSIHILFIYSLLA